MTGLIPFTTWPFQATGAPTPRTMPNRLADIHNVLDFGADPTGQNDSSGAFQAAVNWTSNPNKGIIFFPVGNYLCNNSVTYNDANISIIFKGEGGGTFINGGPSGYIFDRHLASPSNTGQVVFDSISIGGGGGVNQGAIRAGSCSQVSVRCCQLSGWAGFTSEDSPGNSSTGIVIEAVKFPGGFYGLVMGGSGAVMGCDWTSCEIAANMYGKGWGFIGNRIERCNTAVKVGLDTAVAATFTGTIANSGFNACVLTVSSIISGTIVPGQALSDGGVNVPLGISILYQLTGAAGGTGTYQISNPQVTISSPQTIWTIGNDQGASGFGLITGSTEGNWVDWDFAGTCSAFYAGDITLRGHSSSNAGITPGILGTQYHVLVRGGGGTFGQFNTGCSSGVFEAVNAAGDLADVAGGALGTSTSRGNLLFQMCDITKGASSQPGAVDFVAPKNAYTASFIQNSPTFRWTFSQLPSGANVLEGDQFNVSDINGTWGTTYTGGGTTKGLVRWNGSAYTVVAT